MTAINATPAATIKTPLTKEQKIAAVDKQIAGLQQRRQDIIDGVERKAGKAQIVPVVGDTVMVTVGRNTPTSSAKVVEGKVIAIKLPALGADGKATGGVQVRVRINEGGFDEQLVTAYPGQMQIVPKAEAATVTDTDGELDDEPSFE